LARQAGIKIAITTDAHSIHEFRYLQYGVDQARRAGLPKSMILNHLPWLQLGKTFKERS
jgi:DNA polymerase (family 10)